MDTVKNFFVAIVIPLLIFGIICVKKTQKEVIVRWECKDVLIILILFQLSRIFLPFIAGREGSTLIHQIGILQVILIYLIYKLIFQKYSIKIENIGLKKCFLGLNVNLGLRIGLIYFLIILSLIIISKGGYLELTKKFQFNQIPLDFLGKKFLFCFTTFIEIFFVPFSEELFILGIIYPIFRAKIGKDGAIFWSAIMYATMHGIFINLAALILFGIIKAITYEKTNSLIPCIIIHSFYNASGYLLLFFSSTSFISQKRIVLWFFFITGIFFIILQSIARRNKKLITNRRSYA